MNFSYEEDLILHLEIIIYAPILGIISFRRFR